MPALRELFASFTTSFDAKPLEHGANVVDGLLGKLKHLGAALGEAAIVAGVVEFTHHVIETSNEVRIMSQRLGLAVESLEQWEYVGKIAGVTTEELAGGLRLVQRHLFEASKGGGEAAQDFHRLGISMQDVKDGDIDVVLTKMADGFAGLENPIERTALAQKLFGRGGAAMLPVLLKGSKGIEQLKEEFEELGGGPSADVIQASKDNTVAFARLSTVTKGLSFEAVKPLIELATWVAEKLVDWVKHTRELTKRSSLLQAALVILFAAAAYGAAATLIAFAPLIATTLAWAAAITAAVLILDDIITLFRGGKSVIGEWIDAQYGAGTAASWVQDVKKWWEDLQPKLDQAWESFKGMLPSIQETFEAIRSGADDMMVLGNTIAFVIEQWRDLTHLFDGTKGGGAVGKALSRIGAPVRKLLGSQAVPGSEDALTPEEQADQVRQQKEFDRSAFGRFEGRSSYTPATPNSAVTMPEIKIPGSGGGQVNMNEIHVHVDANTKADPELHRVVTGAVSAALDANARKLNAAVGGI